MIVGLARAELFIIDNYLDTQLFDVYMERVSSSVYVRVMTRQVSDSLKLVAEKFSKRGGFELRSSTGVHDRVVFARRQMLGDWSVHQGCRREEANLYRRTRWC